MSLKFKDIIGIVDHTRRFNSKIDIDDPDNWSFKYTTQNTDGDDITLSGGNVDYDKSHYPTDTIFFDSSDFEIYANSSVENIIIDNTPPEYVSSKIQHTTVKEDHKCSITFKSDTYLDVMTIDISCGDNPLYKTSRKDGTIVTSTFIDNLILDKKADIYTLTFTLSNDAEFTKRLNDNHLIVTVWDLAGNKCVFEDTSNNWASIDDDEALDYLQRLQITFINIKPENRILNPNKEAIVTVQIYNPNRAYWSIYPTIELTDDSIGYLDERTLTPKSNYNCDGIVTFNVTNISDSGYVIVHAFIGVDNKEIYTVVKTSTENTAYSKKLYATEEGRKYDLTPYVPNFVNDEHYAHYIDFVQQFMNTCFTGLDSGKYISILEKIARINNFNDVQAIEQKLLDQFRVTYNIEVNPCLEDLKTYLENKTVSKETVYTTVTNNDESSVTTTDTGATVKSSDSDDIVTTETVTTTESAYKNPLTLDDVNEMMRYVYKTIPYYNQIKGTRNGIKMILNTMGLCVKLVDIWSEHNTLSNTNNGNNERRADELQAEIYDTDYNSIDIDIGKFYLTSRFDVDIGQTDLTFKEFNQLAKNLVNIIFQVKPVTRVLRKLSYIFSANTDLHFKYFSLVNANHQQYYCYDYLWDLFDDYSMSKSEHDTMSRTCSKLFVPFKANYAQVTYKAESDHLVDTEHQLDIDDDGIADNINAGTVITRKTNTNTFHNLCNIERKLRRSNETVLRIYYAYFEKRKETVITKETDEEGQIKLSVNSKYGLFMNSKFDAGFDDQVQDLNENPKYDLFKIIDDKSDMLAKYQLKIPDQAKITSNTNGFTIDFNKASVALLRKSYYRNTLKEILKTSTVSEDGNTVTNTEIEPVGMYLILKFAIPLGTNFITQFVGSDDQILIINPEEDDCGDSPQKVRSDANDLNP